MSEFKSILEGWTKYAIGEVATDEEAKRRAKICATCPERKEGVFSAVLKDYLLKEIQGTYCGVCKCALSAKVRSKTEKCSLKKWQKK